MTGVVEGKVLVEGNQAAALGALMGGVTVAAWYPITPSSSLCEYLIAYTDRFRIDPKTGEKRIAIVQAEDELAAVGMAIGAGWAGARSMTSTSGPGISLMAEFAGLALLRRGARRDLRHPADRTVDRAAHAHLAGRHRRSPTRCRTATPSTSCCCPGTVEECYEFARDAFDYADRFQTPVFVLSDLDLGMNLWMTPEFKYPEKPFDRGKVLSKDDLERLAGEWARYRDVDGDGVTYRTLPGTDHPAAGYFTRGSGHDEHARYTENADAYARNMDRLSRKLETARAGAAGAGRRRDREVAGRPDRVRLDARRGPSRRASAGRGRPAGRLPAPARAAAVGRGRRVRRAPRARLRRRAEPRRPGVRPDPPRPAAGARRARPLDPPLQRPADPGRSRSSEPLLEAEAVPA